MRDILSISTALVVVLTAATLRAAEWGDLTGKFVLAGDVKAAELKPNKDVDFCGKHKIPDERLVIGPSKGIKNIIVFLYLKEDEKSPVAHPDYDKTANDELALDNKNCRFEPRVTLLRTTQTLILGNQDAVGHNTKLDFSENQPINPLISPGGSTKVKCPKMEPRAVAASCAIHPWMTSWVLVRDNPYFAVTDEEGKFTIKNVPAGKRTFQFFHESSGNLGKELKQNGKPLTWTKGRTDVTITSKGVDLGAVQIGVAAFTRK